MSRRHTFGITAMLVITALLVPIRSASAAAPTLAYGDVLPITGGAYEIEVDSNSGLVYVSSRLEDVVQVVDPLARQVVNEINLPARPVGLSISPDGSLLYTALYGMGAVAEIDTATGDTLRTFDLSEDLGDDRTWDVQLAGSDLYVSSNPGSNGFAWIVQLDLNTLQSQRVASDDIIRAGPAFDWDGGDALLVGEGFSPPSLYRLDLSQPDAPKVAEDDHGDVSSTQHAVFASNGARIITGYQEIDPADMSVLASAPGGYPATLGGSLVFLADFKDDASMRIRRYNVPNQTVSKTYNTTCANLSETIYDFKLMPGATVFLASYSAGLCIVNTTEAFPKCGGMAPTIIGTTIGEEIQGTTGNDVILSLAGNDEIWALGGNDRICAGAGDDEVRPGDGNDKAFGGPGNDTLSYVDVDGPLTIDLGAKVVIGSGTETISSFENALGSNGNDTIRGTDGPNLLDGGNGNDNVVGLKGADTLRGDDGIDTLLGGKGNDDLDGGNDEDILEGGPGKDDLYGGGGSDFASYENAAGPVVVNLAKYKATGEGTDTLSSIENVAGSAFDDVLKGNNQGNEITGLGGDDEIRGAGGDDLLDGWIGRDTVFGGGGGDTLWGYDGIDQLFGGPGNDLMLGEKGNDLIDGGAGADAVTFAFATGGVTIDLGAGTSSGEGSDTLVSIIDAAGGPHADTIRGSAAGNILVGLEGHDEIFGLGGNDALDGREGTDTLRGGNGTDECYNGENHFSCESVFDVDLERLVEQARTRIWRY